MLVPKQIFEEDMDKKSYGGNSSVLSSFAGRIPSIISKNDVTMILINQVRMDLGNPYNLYSTPGGKAIKHLYSLRMLCKKGDLLDKDGSEIPSKSDEPAGNRVEMKIEKTKVFPPNRRLGYYTLMYHTGIDELMDLIDVALWLNLIKQAGAWFTILDQNEEPLMIGESIAKFQGKVKLMASIREDEFLIGHLKKRIEETLK